MGFGGFGPAQGVFGGNATFTTLTVTGAATFASTVTATGQFLAGDGTQALPGFAFASEGTLGFFRSSAGYVFFKNNGGAAVFRGDNWLLTSPDGLFLGSSSAMGWVPTTDPDQARDLFLYRDAANVLAQRNDTNAQENRTYARYDSATKYHRTSMRSAIGTASAVSGASVALTGLIPDGAVVVGVTTEVATGLGVTGGTTGYQVGDGTDPDRWGAITGTAAGTKSDNTNATATTVQMFVAANDVVLTAVGGNFDGTGAIRVTVHYLIAEAAYA